MLNVAINETLNHANFHENKIDKLPEACWSGIQTCFNENWSLG